MTGLGRQRAAAESAASAALRERAAAAAAWHRLAALAHRKLASPGFLLASFAGGVMAGAAAGRFGAPREAPPSEHASRPDAGGRWQRLAPAGIALLKVLERYAQRRAAGR